MFFVLALVVVASTGLELKQDDHQISEKELEEAVKKMLAHQPKSIKKVKVKRYSLGDHQEKVKPDLIDPEKIESNKKLSMEIRSGNGKE